jgi:hypothetical protein
LLVVNTRRLSLERRNALSNFDKAALLPLLPLLPPLPPSLVRPGSRAGSFLSFLSFLSIVTFFVVSCVSSLPFASCVGGVSVVFVVSFFSSATHCWSI